MSLLFFTFMEETKEMNNMYNLFRSCIYIFLIIEIIINLPIQIGNPILLFVEKIIIAFKVFNSVTSCKVIELICIMITCIGTRASKKMVWNAKTMVLYPLCMGLTCMCVCIIAHSTSSNILAKAIYIVATISSTMLIHVALDNIAKHYSHDVGKDRFNFENESFEQATKKIENEYSVNIPMLYYHKGKMHNGWINVINPFRGTWVVGTPGSGKTFSVIEPFMRQHAKKGFSMVVYDFKFPTLAKKLFYFYCKNKKYGHTPKNCEFRIINFTNVEYSNRVNPIQKKYIDSIAAASETAETLFLSLQKGGGEKKGGSDAFFQNSAVNFLAAIIYFFVNFHIVGWLGGKKLNHYVMFGNQKLKVIIRNWHDYQLIDDFNNVIIDFIDNEGNNVSLDKDGLPVKLENFSYIDVNGQPIVLGREFYENEEGKEVVPDTMTGEYSDMPHVLTFLSMEYNDIFDVLLQDLEIMPLVQPFKSALDNKAGEQLEGMVGTLRVMTSRLVTKESFWVFTGDDFDLKVSDPDNPSYLVIANDPEKEQITGSLNALILNRLITRVNSGYGKNIPVSIIADELPTIYFHKIDRLIGTARSNKVAVTLGFQELPQLESDYGKIGMEKVVTVCGNVLAGSARSKNTLEWLQNDLFGKVKQLSKSITITDSKTSTTISEKMDNLVPAAKISDMPTGWLCGQTARDFVKTDIIGGSDFDLQNSEEFQTNKFFCKTNFDMKQIKKEEEHYVDIPIFYKFADETEKNVVLNQNYQRINQEVEDLINELLGKNNK